MRTAESRKYHNTWRNGKLQVLGNIGKGHHQISGTERKKKLKKSIPDEQESLSKPSFAKEISPMG